MVRPEAAEADGVVGGAPSRRGASRLGLPEVVAALAFAWLVCLVLYLAGRPLATDDFWWHLKLGEIYWNAGPWLDEDPLLHTAQMKPDPASWVFDIALHLLHAGVGFQGLRLIHVLLVAAIVWQAFGLLRRESGSVAVACAATAVVVCLSWYRLIQFRPDLVSILAMLVIVRLLLEGSRTPSWGRVAVAMLVLLVWVNSHALYLLGVLACALGFVATALRAGMARLAARRGGDAPEGWANAGPQLVRLGVAASAGVVVTLLNPRGAARHTTFFKSSGENAIWQIRDEWTPFDPFTWSDRNPAASLLAVGLVDVLFSASVLLVLFAAIAALRRPRAQALALLDPMLLGLAAVAFLAIATAIRFEWMAVFPLLLLARGLRIGLVARPGLAAATRLCAAALCVALAVALPPIGGYALRAEGVPHGVAPYLESPVDGYKYYTQGVRFLRDAGLQGNLFNSYFMGGYLAYWLAPGLRTFVGGTLNYPEEVAAAHRAIAALESDSAEFDALRTLDAYAVDVFFGVGLPVGGPQRGPQYTSAHLEGAPGWRLVFRTLRSAIYLRANDRNRENLARVAAFYRAARIPFDPAVGLDVEQVIRERSDWAREWGLLPPRAASLAVESHSEDPETRAQALARLGDAYAAGGAYTLAIESDRALLALRPDDGHAYRRLVYALLRLDRIDEASEAADAMLAVSPDADDDARSRAFAIAARRYAEQRRRTPGLHPVEGGPSPARALVNRMPLFTAEEALRAIGG